MTKPLELACVAPVGWRSVRLKDIATYVNRGVAPEYADGETGLLAFNQKCVRPDLTVAPELGRPIVDGSFDRDSPALLGAGDIVLNSTGRGTLGRAALVQLDPDRPAVADGHVTIIRTKPDLADARFVAYVLGTSAFYDQANTCLAVGATNQTELNREPLRRMAVVMPPLDEQRAIARRLDEETALIDALIDEQQQLAFLVNERLDAVRESAFWAWPERRLKEALIAAPTYGVLVPVFVEEGVPFVRVGDISTLASPDVPERAIDPALSAQYRRTVLSGGEVLVSVVGSLGHAGVVPPRLAGANVARAVAVLRVNEHLSSPLLAHFVRTRRYQDQAALATGSDTAQPTLGMGDLSNFVIPLPPTPAELLEASARLDAESQLATGLLQEIDAQIALLREHRQALITAAVTGGLDALERVA